MKPHLLRQRSFRSNQRGFGMLSVLMALMIIGILTTNYLSTDVPGGKPWAVQQQDRARAAVTAMNTRAAETQYMMHTEGRRPDINQLRILMNSYSQTMGSGGRFFVDHRDKIHITTALQTKGFREQYALPWVK